MFLNKEPKMSRIRKYLVGLVGKGELDLSKPVPNSKVREIAEALREEYGEDFNVNTISSVVRELRVHNELDNGDSESSESESPESESSEPEPEKGRGGGAWKIVVGVIVGIAVIGVSLMLLTGRLKSWLSGGQSKQGVSSVNSTVSS